MNRHISNPVVRSLALLTTIPLIGLLFGCESSSKKIDSTPSEAYTELFNAVKSKDSARIKSSLSQGTLSFAEFISKQQGKNIDEVVRNGFTETTFADSLPEMRDEKIKDSTAQIEVYSSKSQKWEVIPFVLENGRWKAAFGDLFSGKWKSPGKSLSQIEQEKAGGPFISPAKDGFGPIPPTVVPIDPSLEQDALRKANPTLGPNAKPSPVPNNPTIR